MIMLFSNVPLNERSGVRMENRFGICEWSMPVRGTEAIKFAARIGFDGIQIGEAGGRLESFPLNDMRTQQNYKEAAEKYGIQIHSLNLGSLLQEGTLNRSPDSNEGRYARESILKALEVCNALGIKTIVITADPSTEEEMENAAAHIRFAAKEAGMTGIEIAVESADTAEQIGRLLYMTGAGKQGSNVKLCMDILNPLRFNTGNPWEQIQIFGREMISHFHMKDSLKSLFNPGERGCVILGTGDGGYQKSAEAIKKIGFEGWFITENYYYLPPMSGENKDFSIFAAKDLSIMKKSI